ncbi:MAG: DUF192 domain-containing protein [Pseudomonadota bacterium]
MVRSLLWLVLTLFMLASPAAAMGRGEVTIETQKGSFSFTVEMTETPEEKSRGLMHRRSMPRTHGMVFTWNPEQHVSMWMANTILSLDMVFIKADGRVHRVHENAIPFSRDNIESGVPVKWVLELNAGTAAEIGLKPGDSVKIN